MKIKQKFVSTKKKVGGEKVNKFFRRKNLQHTENYKSMIES